jgi:hypothetical protein
VILIARLSRAFFRRPVFARMARSLSAVFYLGTSVLAIAA